METYTQVNLDINIAPRAPTNSALVSGCMGTVENDVRRSERMHNLIYHWPVQSYMLVVRVTQLSESVSIVATALRLEYNLSPSTLESADKFLRCFIIALLLIIHLERRPSVKNEECGHSSITGTIR